MSKLSAAFDVFFKGAAVANPEAWRKGQITASAIAALLTAVVEVSRAFFNVQIPLSSDDTQLLGAGVLVLVNAFCHVVRHDDVGLPQRNHPDDPPAGRAGEAKPVADATRDVGSTNRDPGPG